MQSGGGGGGGSSINRPYEPRPAASNNGNAAGGWPRLRQLGVEQGKRQTVLEMPTLTGRLDPYTGVEDTTWSQWVAALLGKKGATVQAIQNESGAVVDIQRQCDVPPGATVRIITITGTVPQRARCEDLIRQRLATVDPSYILANPLAALNPTKRRAVEMLKEMTSFPGAMQSQARTRDISPQPCD